MADTLAPQTLSSLIGSIYDCVLDPSRWEQTLVDVNVALDCHNAMLTLSDLRHHRLLMHKSVGMEPYWQEQLKQHVPEVHALLVEPLASSPDEPLLVSRQLTRSYQETSPFVQNFLKPQGIVDIMQLFLIHTPTRLAGVGIGRHERHGIVTEREVELARLLIPHLRRAVTISDVLDVRTIERAWMAEALNALRCAVVLTDGRGAILHANRAAEEMLCDGGLIRGAGGALQATTPSAAAELRAAIKLAAEDETEIGKTGLAIRLTGLDAPPVLAHVLPMTGGDLRTRLQPATVAAVFIGGPPDEQDAATAIAATYGLTPAETRVLASLLAGRTLAETAAALGIAATTARSHLDHIFAKTGVFRQAELMRLGARVAPPTKTE
jgi:DNA-binding CsgD family transcriptional regulator/PAS domain-containing protein